MIFQHGDKVAGLDNIIDILNNPQLKTHLQNYNEEVLKGNASDNLIEIPIAFAFVHSNDKSFYKFKEKAAFKLVTSEVLPVLNSSFKDFNIQFKLASKLSDKIKKSRGVVGVPLEEDSTTTSYKMEIVKFNYDETGVACNLIDKVSAPIRGINRLNVDQAISKHIDTTKVFTIAFVNYLNNSSLENQDSVSPFNLSIHPVSSGPNLFYGILPYWSLAGKEDILDIHYSNSDFRFPPKDSFKFKNILNNLIGSMFGLKPEKSSAGVTDYNFQNSDGGLTYMSTNFNSENSFWKDSLDIIRGTFVTEGSIWKHIISGKTTFVDINVGRSRGPEIEEPSYLFDDTINKSKDVQTKLNKINSLCNFLNR